MFRRHLAIARIDTKGRTRHDAHPLVAGLVALGLGAMNAPAQVLLPGYGYGRIGYGGIGFGLVQPRVRVGFSLGGVYGGGFGYLGCLGISPFGYPRNQVTVFYTPPPILLAPPPRLFLDELNDELKPPPRDEVPAPQRVQPPPVPAEPPEMPLPKGDPVGGFRPLAPDNRARTSSRSRCRRSSPSRPSSQLLRLPRFPCLRAGPINRPSCRARRSRKPIRARARTPYRRRPQRLRRRRVRPGRPALPAGDDGNSARAVRAFPTRAGSLRARKIR